MNQSKSIKSEAGERKARNLVIAVSLAIPVVVTFLYFMKKLVITEGPLKDFLDQLPLVNASVNGLTAVLLIAAFVAIKNKNVALHKKLMTICLLLSVVFLLSYVTYHSTHETTVYGGEGGIRTFYYFILLSHIVLSAVIVPMVLFSYTRAISERFDKHRKLARITLPIWFYVAVTGVLVYLMISPYYS
jgi:putative membrane protein